MLSPLQPCQSSCHHPLPSLDQQPLRQLPSLYLRHPPTHSPHSHLSNLAWKSDIAILPLKPPPRLPILPGIKSKLILMVWETRQDQSLLGSPGFLIPLLPSVLSLLEAHLSDLPSPSLTPSLGIYCSSTRNILLCPLATHPTQAPHSGGVFLIFHDQFVTSSKRPSPSIGMLPGFSFIYLFFMGLYHLLSHPLLDT